MHTYIAIQYIATIVHEFNQLIKTTHPNFVLKDLRSFLCMYM